MKMAAPRHQFTTHHLTWRFRRRGEILEKNRYGVRIRHRNNTAVKPYEARRRHERRAQTVGVISPSPMRQSTLIKLIDRAHHQNARVDSAGRGDAATPPSRYRLRIKPASK